MTAIAMDAGKLPNELLARLLSRVQPRDPRVIIGPGIGRDAAVIDTGGPRLLVAKTDPVTFATGLIGSYAVHVNANDIACTGATPAWFLATALLPEGADPQLPASIFDQLIAACDELNIALVGGHTEITIGLDRPIVIGAMLGEVDRDRLIRPDGGRPGDALILTQGIAIEGTCVLAREAPDRLQALGVDQSAVVTAQAYLADPGISVVRAALAASDALPVHAMHDPTEGGLATALYELAEASGVGIHIEPDQVKVLPATKSICQAAALDPLGLLASGALLIAVAENDFETVVSALAHIGVPATRIGSLAPPATGVIMMDKRGPRPVPRFSRDEVARFLSQPDQTKEHRGRAETEDH